MAPPLTPTNEWSSVPVDGFGNRHMIDDIKVLTCTWSADIYDFCDTLTENGMIANLTVTV
jgi:hypothetical protein